MSPIIQKRPLAKSHSLATDPQLIETIQKDIDALGLVGERDLRLLVYVVGVSRLLDNPLAITAGGASGSGKTYTQMTVMQMMPPEDVIIATSMTPSSLYRMEPGSLKHKILVTGERRHGNKPEDIDANAALRQLLSEGRISRMCPIEKGGTWKTETLEQEGPVAYCETSTSPSIFSEDLNRMLQVTTDRTEEQTRAIMEASAREYALRNGVDHNKLLDKHREFQRSLTKCKVVIPYAVAIAQKMPAFRIEARRIIGQVMATIEAVTTLYQYWRKKDGRGYLLATLDDYRIARQLLVKPMQAALGTSKEAKYYLNMMSRIPHGQVFTTTEFAERSGIANRVTSNNNLERLAELGLARRVRPARGNIPAAWAWTEIPREDDLLPPVKEIAV